MPKRLENEDGKVLSSIVKFDVDESRMLRLSHLCTTLPVFSADALRDNYNCSVRFLPQNWLLIVAGTELFVWKYACSATQSQSHCLRFSLPTSEIVHSALLVALLFSHPTYSEGAAVPLSSGAGSLVPAGCIVLSSGGGNLRVWPRLTREYVYTDHSLSAPIGGLYGDEAMQLEPIHVPGVFVVATRTCHLVVIDVRNAQQQAVACRVLACDGGGGTGGLISNLGRRVSTLLTAVTPTAFGGSQHQLLPEHGGGNAVFVRLLTLPRLSNGITTTSYIFLLMKKRLDIWSLDSNLKERYLTTSFMESLLPDGMFDQPRVAVDMATRYPPAVTKTFTSPWLYLLMASSRNLSHLILVSMTFQDDRLTVFQVINTSDVQWPFQMVAPRLPHFVPGDAEVFTDGNSCVPLQLCLHDSTDTIRCLFGDFHQSQQYPSLLASVYCQSLGQVAIFEVLTGRLIATLDFFQSTSVLARRSQSQFVSGLVSVAPGTVTSDPQLFVFLTRQRGLIGLGSGGRIHTTDFQASGVTSTNTSRSTLEVGSATTRLDRLYRSSIHPSKDGDLCDATSEDVQAHRGTRDDVIIVDSTNQGRLQVVCQHCDAHSGSPDALTILDAVHSIPIDLAPEDKAFVCLCEVARISWMGFKEQASVYLRCLLDDRKTSSFLPISAIRFTKRLLNEPPISDPRWQKFLPTTCSGDGVPAPFPEGCCSFQFVVLQKMIDSPPLLFKHRLKAKLEAVARLRELLSFLFTNVARAVDEIATLLDLSDVHSYLLGPLLPAGANRSSSLPPRRQYAGEQDTLWKVHTSTLPFSCTLADEDNNGGSNPEEFASQLLISVDLDRAVQAGEDAPLDQVGYSTKVHVLAGLSMAEEIVEFAKAVYVRLTRESTVSFQAAFKRTAASAGYPANFLSMVNSQDVVLQTLTLMPSLVIELGEAVSRELNSHEEGLPGEPELQLPDESQPPKLHRNHAGICLLTETGRLISAGLTEVVVHRDRLLQSAFNNDSHEVKLQNLGFSSEGQPGLAHYLPCWLTDARPYGVGDALLNLFDQLVCCGGGEWVTSCSTSTNSSLHQQDLVHEAAMLAVEWASCLLRLGHQRIQWATATSRWVWSAHCASTSAIHDTLLSKTRLETVQRLRRMRFWYTRLRDRLITAVSDRLHMPEVAVSLAERFADCQQMVRLCHLLESQSTTSDDTGALAQPHFRLAELLSRVPANYGLAECALQWYLSSGEHARVQSLLTLLASYDRRESPDLAKLPSEIVHSNKPEHTAWSQSPQISLSNVHTGTPNSNRASRVPGVCLPTNSDDTPSRATVQRFLNRQDTRDHAWSHLFATGQYTQAADLLLQEGCREKRFLGRRKTLLSLCKLARLSPSTASLHPVAPNDRLPVGEVAASTTRDSTSDLDAADPPPQATYGLVTLIDLLLELIQLQEQLPSELRTRMHLDRSRSTDDDETDAEELAFKNTDKNYSTSHSRQPLKRSYEPVLDPYSLARLYLDCPSVAEDDGDENEVDQRCQLRLIQFLAAIRIVFIIDHVLDQQPVLLAATSRQDLATARKLNRDFLLHIWCQAIKQDDWQLDDNLDEITALDACRSRFVWRLICKLRTHYNAWGDFLPEPEELLQCDELTELTGSQNFTYLVHSGFEHLKAVAG